MFEKQNRKTIRLKDWDYSQEGWYLVTICTKDKNNFFGEVRNAIVGLSDIGCVAYDTWQEVPDHFEHVKLDTFVIMPNHVHGIMYIKRRETACCFPTDRGAINRFQNIGVGSLSTIIRSYKSAVTKQVRKFDKSFAWQGRFYDRIIRNKVELNKWRQ